MKYIKWILIGMGSVIAAVLLAVLGIQFYLNTDAFGQRIQAKVNQTIPGTVTWRQNQVSVLGGKVELNHVSLADPENNRLIELERFSIHMSWIGLLKGELGILDLSLKNPIISLVKDHSGNLNLIQAIFTPGDKPSASGKNGGLPFNILIHRLSLINGSLQYRTFEKTSENQTDRLLLQNVDLTITNGNLLKQSGRLACRIAGGKLQSNGVRTAIDQLSLEADFQKDRINGLIFETDINGIHTKITGSVESLFTETPILDLHLKSRVSLFKIKELMTHESEFSGIVQVNATVKGTLDNPNIDLALSYEGGKLAGNRFGQIHLYCRLTEKILNINDIDLHTPLGDFNIRGDVSLKNAFKQGVLTSNPDLDAIFYKFSIIQKDFHLDKLPFNISSLKGVTGAKIKLEGQGVYPNTIRAKSSFELDLNKLTVGTAHSPFHIHVSAHANMKNGRIAIEKLVAGAGESRLGSYDNSRLDISGFARIFDPKDAKHLKYPDFDISLKGDSLFLEDVVQGMKGKLVLNGRIKGSYDHPKGHFNLSGTDLDLDIQKLKEIKLASTIDGRQIHIDPLLLVIAPDENIKLKGWVSMDKQYELDMISSDISIKHIQKLASLKMKRGKISFDISGKGVFSNPRFKGKAVIDDLMLNYQKLKKIPFNINVENQTVYIDGGSDFDLKAIYKLQTRSFSTSAHFDHTDLTPYLHLFGKKELNGTITGSIDARGDLIAPFQIDGAAKIAQLGLFWKNTALITGREIGVFLKKDEITIPKMRLSLPKQGYFIVHGAGRLRGSLDLNAEGVIPLEVLPMLTDSFSDAAGEARISLRISGNDSQSTFNCDAFLKNGSIMIPNLFQKFHDIDGHVRVTPKAVVVDNIKGMLGKGKFNLSGIVDLEEYQPSNIGLMLNVDELPISIPDLLDVRLNSELDVRGSSEKVMVKGDIELIEGKYTKDVRLNLLDSFGQKSREEPLMTPKTPWPIFNNMVLDCRIRYREPFVVDNNIALLNIKPDLNVFGTVNQPRISGRAEVDSGTVYFQKNEFNVKKGVLDFINPYKIEPVIDIQSEVNIRKWTIFLEILGTPDNLRINMTSNPSEREEDILSLLVSGKTTQELITGEGGSSLSPGQMLADVLAENVQKDIKDITGLDIVELEYNEAKDAETTDEVKVTLGKELSRRVTVKYGLQTKNSKVIRRVVTEYKFFEKLIMNAFQDTEGHYGGGVQFRIEFR